MRSSAMMVARMRLRLSPVLAAAIVAVLAFGAVPAFALEAPVTREAKLVTGSSAELRGELNPLAPGSEDRYEFDYNMGGSCENGPVTAEEPEMLLPGLSGERLAVSSLVTGLEGSSEYTFCVVELHEGEGPEKGGGLHFRTASAAPVVEGESVSGVTPFAATLEASVNPEDEEASCEFEYGTSPTLAGASKVPCASRLPASQGAETATASAGGLSPSTKYYYYRVVAGNGGGTKQGAIEKFETPAASAPVIEFLEEPESGVKVFVKVVERFSLGVVVLQAKVDPEFQQTACVFEYSTSPALEVGKTASASCEPELGTGGGFLEPKGVLLGLKAGETYYYRVSAANGTGSPQHSPIESFVPGAPVVEGESASEVLPSGAKLEARVNPEFEETSCVFEYSDTSPTLASGVDSVPCVPGQLGSDGGGVSVSAVLSGLTDGKAYYYRVRAHNEAATSRGKIEQFATPALLAPIVEDQGTPEVYPFEARIEASIDPEYQETTCKLEYSRSETLEPAETTTVACPEAIKNPGGGGVGVSIVATGLSEKTKYHYRVDATNGKGSEDHAIEEFTTGEASKPRIEGESAGEVTPTSVLLEAQIDPGYLATSYEFQYTTGHEAETRLLEGHGTIVPGGTVPAGSIATGFGEHHATAPLTGLTPDTTYYYRVVAHNAMIEPATQNPVVATFTTASTPEASTGAASVLSPSEAELLGSVTPDGIPTTYRFQYGGTEAYGKETPALQAGSGDGAIHPAVRLTGLEPGVTYHYRILATNIDTQNCSEIVPAEREACEHIFNATGTYRTPQTSYGEDRTFTLPATPPTIAAVEGVATGQESATIAARIDGHGLATRWEALLAAAGPGGGAPSAEAFLTGASGIAQSASTITGRLTGLTPGTTYYYKFTATGPSGTAEAGGTFTTQAAPAPALLGAPVAIAFPAIATATTTGVSTGKEPKPATKKQKLAKALKACRKDRNKHKRAACEKSARARYGAKKR